VEIFNRLVSPGETPLHDGPGLYTYAEQAWSAAARALTDGVDMNMAQRMKLIGQMLSTDATGRIGDWRVLRFAHTNVDLPVSDGNPAAKEVRREVSTDGIVLAQYAGVLGGTYANMVRALLVDLLADAEDDGVQVRASIAVTDLPEPLREQGPPRAIGTVWLQGIAYDIEGDDEVVFADGHRVHLSAAEFIHVTY
jgi:hypothetical protein